MFRIVLAAGFALVATGALAQSCPPASWMAVRLSLLANSCPDYRLTKNGVTLRSASIKVASKADPACYDIAMAHMATNSMRPVEAARSGGEKAKTDALCSTVADEVEEHARAQRQPSLVVKR